MHAAVFKVLDQYKAPKWVVRSVACMILGGQVIQRIFKGGTAPRRRGWRGANCGKQACVLPFLITALAADHLGAGLARCRQDTLAQHGGTAEAGRASVAGRVAADGRLCGDGVHNPGARCAPCRAGDASVGTSITVQHAMPACTPPPPAPPGQACVDPWCMHALRVSVTHLTLAHFTFASKDACMHACMRGSQEWTHRQWRWKAHSADWTLRTPG